MNIDNITTGYSLWQLSKILSESENELWLAENITLFFLPMKLGSKCILSTVLSSEAIFGIDIHTMSGGTSIPILPEYHGMPIYSLMRKPMHEIILTDSAMYNLTAKSYMTEYNLQNVLRFLNALIKRTPKNAHEGILQDILVKKSYDGMSFFEYLSFNGKN